MINMTEISFFIGLVGGLYLLINTIHEKDVFKTGIMAGTTTGVFLGFVAYSFNLDIPPYVRIMPYVLSVLIVSILTYKQKIKVVKKK